MSKREHIFHITILGRTLEHLGVQMYKRRDVAIAELVANCWDAGAKNVWIIAPDPHDYDQFRSRIIITDDGGGMNANQVQNEYLVVGRNRRTDKSKATVKKRRQSRCGRTYKPFSRGGT